MASQPVRRWVIGMLGLGTVLVRRNANPRAFRAHVRPLLSRPGGVARYASGGRGRMAMC